jgi:hypothetical protein
MRSLSVSLSFIIILCVSGCGKPPEIPETEDRVSWETLLVGAADLNSLLSKSMLGESRLFSSAAGAANLTLAGYAPEHYGDLDHGSFLEVKDVPGGVEAVLAEMEGAGVISWIWSANPVGELILEIDGKETVCSFRSFMNGKWLPKRSPFAARTAEGFNLHFPILHKNQCSVRLRAKSRADLGSLFYQISWNALETEKQIESFSLDAVSQNTKGLDSAAGLWRKSEDLVLVDALDREFLPGAWQEALSVEGNGVLQCLEVQADSKEELSHLILEATWDRMDVPSLSCPLYILCGVSTRFEDVDSLPVSVKGSTVRIYWPMPFKSGAKIRLKNDGGKPFHCRVAVSLDRDRESSYRFAGNYDQHRNLLAEEANFITLSEITGSGKIVGCIMQVENQSDGWWGEGDPVIWLDDEEKPAWRGTGTEDYFGFAWCSTAKFQHLFRGQTGAGPSYAAMYRYHILGALPFRKWARFDFEAHGIGRGSMDYSTLLLWYSSTSSMND